jgi:hypothetical protein
LPKRIFLSELNPLIEETLQGGGEVAFSPAGNSMRPMLRSRQDKIVLVKPPDNLKRYDIPLYQRDNGKFVLHRVVDVKKEGYALCGDHQWQVEYGVKHEQIIGVVKAFYRGDKYIDCGASKVYRLYCLLWTGLLPVRSFFFRWENQMKRAREQVLCKIR